MYDPTHRRIAKKKHVWSRVKNGGLMTMAFDLEGSGLGAQKVPYAMPGSTFTTEWGDIVKDISGNYLNSAQVLLRRPEWMPFEPSAAIIQRVKGMGPELFDGPDRMNYWHGMGSIVDRVEEMAFAYEEMAKQLGDKPKYISITDLNKAFRREEVPGQAAGAEEVYEVPLEADDGRIVYDVRYHPIRRKISYRFHKDGKNWDSDDYRAEDNLYYRDEADGSLWKWVEPSLFINGFNSNNYDMRVFRADLYRVGFSPANTTLLYARATPTSKQRKKPHGYDVRDLMFWVSLYGDQGERGLKMGEMVDPVTGKIRNSESLSAYLANNTGQAASGRLLRGGIFDPRDGSYADLKLAHGAVSDAALTSGADNFCWDIAPDICSMMLAQSDPNKRLEILTSQSRDGKSFPIFYLPRRESGMSHSDLPYWFFDTDDQIGRFGKYIFLKTDGSLHKTKVRTQSGDKYLHELSVEEWVDYRTLQKQRRDPDAPVRFESVRRFPGAIPYDYAASSKTRGNICQGQIDAISKDMKYILQNPEMCQRLKQAEEIHNRNTRFNKQHPHNEFPEDALARKYGNEVYFQDDARAIEEREMFRKTGKGGAQKIPGVLQTIKTGMDNDYKYMTGIDAALDQLCKTAHPIDLFSGYDPNSMIHQVDTPEGRFAKRVLENFTKSVERILKTFKKKDWPYQDIFKTIINPVTGELYIEGTKFKRKPSDEDYPLTVGQAYQFRELLGLRALKDFDTLFRLKDCPYLDGFTGQDFSNYPYGERRLMLYSDADNGQTGAVPHVVNENGHEISLEDLKRFPPKDVLDNISSKRWHYRFYRDRSEPGIMILAHRFITLGLGDKLPRTVRMMYVADVLNRMEGMTHDDASTDRAVTLRVMEDSCKSIRHALTSRDHRVLERDPNPSLTAAMRMLKPEEAMQRLAYIEAWVKAQRKLMKQLRAELVSETIRRTDPKTTLPLDYIPITVPRSSKHAMESDPNLILLDMPIWHMRNPVQQQGDNRLPPKFFVVPALKSNFKEAVNKDKNPKSVLVRGVEDALIAAIGSRSHVMPFDQKDPSMARIWDKVRDDYARAGIALTDKTKLSILAIEDVYPVAGTRKIDWSLPSLKLPKAHFDALVAPVYANMGTTPLTAVLMPVDYFPQAMKVGQKIRLRQMDTEMFSNIYGDTDAPDTGHTYVTTITKIDGLNPITGQIDGIPRGKLIEMIESDPIFKKSIENAGFLGGSVQHVRQVLDGLVTSKWKDRPDEMPLVLVAFQRVNEKYFKNGRQEKDNSYAYCHLTKAPHAALEWDGKPVTPSIYCDMA